MESNPSATSGSSSHGKAPVVLECGTSLAEGEFCDIIERKNVKQQAGAAASNKFQDKNNDGRYATIDELREALARDLMTTTSAKNGNAESFTTFSSPFSVKGETPRDAQLPCVYCDHTASNKSVTSLERYLQQTCLPFYANTHTNTSITGSQSTAFVAEARQLVAEETNAKITGKASQDVVLFTGSGATSAVELLIDCLGIRHAVATASTAGTEENTTRRPVVFVGPYEHHSNLVPWRESGCEVVMVPECPKAKSVDLKALETMLKSYQSVSALKMGTFSAASNVTGKLSDTYAIATLLHKYGCLAFFDYATSAPYVEMNMNPSPQPNNAPDGMVDDPTKDAMFLSPHKMLGGGAGTPGVLIVKKRLVSQSNAPNKSGGGTVFYVTHDHHRFLSNRVERYEGGTPHVAGIWRVGLCFLLKRRVQQEYANIYQKQLAALPSQEEEEKTSNDAIPSTVYEYDLGTYHKVASYLQQHAPKLVLLGHDEAESNNSHLPIFSFLIRFGNRFLHYNYVCAVLNDLFGIQSRGGCQCAGPYSQHLLGLTNQYGQSKTPNSLNAQIEQALVKYKERAELLRPGYTRLSLPFKGLAPQEVEYVMKALVWVSENAWALMCQYRCNHRTGEWRHAARHGKPLGKEERRWLSHYDSFSLVNAPESALPTNGGQPLSLSEVLERTLKRADQVLTEAVKDQRSISQTLKMVEADSVLGDEEGGENLEGLRWYVYSKECASRLSQENAEMKEDDTLLGAINPLQTSTPVVSSTDEDENDGNAVDKKRKISDAEPDGHTDTIMSTMMPKSDVIAFRDGDHQGEAELGEIEEGVADGELSEMTQVFDTSSGEWVEASKCFSLGKKAKVGTMTPVVTIEPKTNLQTKKAPRDQSAWGQGQVADAVIAKPELQTTRGANSLSKQEAVGSNNGKNKRMKHIKPPAKMMRLVIQAVFQWDMIQEGDKLLLGLSGGKDSMSLLHCLMELRRKLPTKFDIEVCTIDPMTPSFDPSPLIPYVESLGLKYHYVKDDIVSRAAAAGKDGKMVSSLCAFCARMKRGNLYNVARQNKCNKLVLAQHLDDCAESFMMSVMHNGFLRTMKANYEIDAGDLSVIRPMVYCRESLMTDFAKASKIPIINENCPACFEEPKERARVKKLLSREEMGYPNFFDCIRRSMIPLMHPLSEAVMHSFTAEAVAKSGRKMSPKPKRAKIEQALPTTPSINDRSQESEESIAKVLAEMTDADLMAELGRRKAARFRRAGAMKTTNEAPTVTGEAMLCEVGGACSHFD